MLGALFSSSNSRIAALAGIVSLALAAPVQAGALGPADYFDVYSLGDINYSYSDFEGVTGAGGNIDFLHFNVGAKIAVPQAYSLHAGGDINFNHGKTAWGGIEAGGNVNLGNVYVGNVPSGTPSIQADVTSGGNVQGHDGTITGHANAAGSVALAPSMTALSTNSGTAYAPTVDHISVADALRAASMGYATLAAPAGLVENKWGQLIFTGSSGMNLFNIDAADLVGIWGMKFVAPEDATMVINVTGTEVNIDRSLAMAYAGGVDLTAVLYNLFQANAFNLLGSLNGTVLAPGADMFFSGNGVLTGGAYVGNLTGSGQINIGAFAGEGPGTPTTVPEPLSLALMGLGLFAMTIARQRRFKRVSV